MDNTSDESSDQTKYQLCNIFKIGNRAICLLCMKDISMEDMGMFRHNRGFICENETVTSHLLSEAHIMKVKSLFRECFPGCLENDYCEDKNDSDVISSLVFDLSLYLGNEPSYISQIGFSVVCLMCSKKLFYACTSERSVNILLFDHLQSEQHMTNLKSWACWIYFFSENIGFVMISQSRVYCFFCKQTITVKGNTLLTALVNHLDNEHNLHLKRSAEYVVMSGNELEIHPERTADATSKDDHEESKLDHYPLNPLRSPEDEKENVQLEKEYDQYPQRSSEDEKDNHLEKEHDHCPQGSPENGKENDQLENEHDHSSLRGPEDTKDNYHLDKYYDYYPLGDPENVNKNDLSENKNDVQPLENVNDAKEKALLEKKFDYDLLGPIDMKDNDHPEIESGSRPHKIAGDATNNDSDMEESVIYSYQTHGDNSVGSPGIRENYGSEFDSEPTDTEDYDDALDILNEDYDDALEVLTCPICGGFVEIINEDAEFSLRLHCQKHKDLQSINTDFELSFNENVEYVCPICHDVIPLFNKNIEISVQRHFEERKIDHQGFGFAKNYDVNPDLLANAFSTFPEQLKKYQSFLQMEENTIFCKICNCPVPLEDVQSNVSKILNDHLSNPFHEEQYRTLSLDVAMVVLDINKQYQNHQPNEQLDLFETLVKKHPLIKENSQFIERRSIHYFCQICQKHISHSLNEHTLALNFMFHLRGPVHTKAFKEVEKSTSEKCLIQRVKKDKEPLKQLKRKMMTTMFCAANKSAGVHMNQNYFKNKMGTGRYHCVICNESIEFSRSGSKLISHCNSSAHNEILMRNASIFVLNLCSSKKNKTEKLRNILDSLASCEFLKPHTEFIFGDERGCRCVVCDVMVPTSKKNIQEHLFGNNHKDNAFKVINQIRLEVKKKIKPAKVKDPKELVKKALASLLQYSPLVAMNSQFIDVKNGHFFCKVCCETIKYSNSGKHLKTHLNSVNHKKNMNR